MSFQDFAGKPTKHATPSAPVSATKLDAATESNNFTIASSSSVGSDGGSLGSSESRREYGQLRDAVMSYHRNVGILQNIARSVGTKADGPTVKQQFEVQVDVIKQLGERIENQLRGLELGMRSISSRTEAARVRATHVKLTRDFRSVEATYKKIVLEVRQRRNVMESKKRTEAEHQAEKARNEESMQQLKLKLMREEEAVNLQIMREREEELRNINRGMHQVNEIYKDLANIVGSQQEQIDSVEKHMEGANVNAKAGLQQVEKANASHGNCVIS